MQKQRVSIAVERADIEQLDKIAERTGQSRTFVIRTIIKAVIQADNAAGQGGRGLLPAVKAGRAPAGCNDGRQV